MPKRPARPAKRRTHLRELLEEFPDLTEQDILACLAYAASAGKHTVHAHAA